MLKFVGLYWYSKHRSTLPCLWGCSGMKSLFWKRRRRQQAKTCLAFSLGLHLRETKWQTRRGFSLHESIPANNWRKNRRHDHFTNSNKERPLGKGDLQTMASQKQRQANIMSPWWRDTAPPMKHPCWDLIMLLVLTINLQAVLQGEGHVEMSQKGNRYHSDCGKQDKWPISSKEK